MGGATTLGSTIATVIIVVILFLIFYQLYKKFTEEPSTTGTGDEGDTGIDVAGLGGGPGAATDELEWTHPDPDPMMGMMNFLAGMLAELIAKKLREMAERYEEEKLRKKTDEKLRTEADRIAERERLFRKEFDNKLRDIENGRVKQLDEYFRDQQDKALRERGLSDEDLKRLTSEAEAKNRSLMEEYLRDQQDRVLRDAGLTDENIRNMVERVEEGQRAAFEEQLRAEQSRALADAGFADEDIQRKIAEFENDQRAAFEEGLRADQSRALADAGFADEDIQRKIAEFEEKQRAAFEEGLRDQQDRVLRDAGLTDEDIQRKVAAVEEGQRAAFEEELRAEQSRALADAGFADEDIQRKIAEFENDQRAAFEEQLRADQSRALADAGFADEDIQRKVADFEQKLKYAFEENFRALQSDALREVGLTDEDLRQIQTAAEEKLRAALEEQLRLEQNEQFRNAGITDEQFNRIKAAVEDAKLRSTDESLRRQASGDFSSQGFTDEQMKVRRELIEKTKISIIEEQFKLQQSRALESAGFSDEDIRTKVASAENSKQAELTEKLRKQQSDLLESRGLTADDQARRIANAEETMRNKFEEKLRAERSSTLLDRGLTEAETARRIDEIDKTYKKYLDELQRAGISRSQASAGVDADYARDIAKRFERMYDERFRVQRSRQTDAESVKSQVNQRVRKFLDEQLRTQISDLRPGKGLTDADWTQKMAEVDSRIRATFEAKLRNALVQQFTSSGLSDADVKTKIDETVERTKKIFEERFRKTNEILSRLTPAERAKLQHFRTSSYEISRMVRGEPRRGEDGRVDESRMPYDSAEGSNKISTKAMSNFSHLQLLVITETKSPLGRNILRALFQAKNGIAKLADNPINRTLDKLAATKAGKALANGFDAINDFLDFAQVVMTFTDAAFYNQFPAEGDLFTTERMDGYSTFTLKSQYDVIGAYNSKMDRQNEDAKAVIDGGGDPPYGFPFAYVQFPLINGPLTQVDMNTPGFEGDVYYNQTRLELEIDAAREYLLRTMEPFKSSIQSSIDSAYGVGTSSTISVDITQTFVDLLKYYDPEFIGLTDSQRDQLYELAYSNVCHKYDGIVYIDYYKYDPHRKGRKRFQCGFKSPLVCNQNTMRWFDELNKGKVIGGEYAEWYNYSELLEKQWTTKVGDNDVTSNILLSNTFQSYQLGGNVYANVATNTNGLTGACMVMNSTLYGICYSTQKDFQENYNVDSVSGAGYDFNTHKCKFTPAYCQSLGTCFQRSTNTCELPGKELEGVSMIFGTGGPREFIRQHGCTVEDGLGNTDPLQITRAGLGVIYEALHRMEDWGPGLKESLGTPVGGLMFATAVMSCVMASNKKAFAALSGRAQFITGAVMGCAMVTMMVLIAVESLAGVYEQRSAPIDDALEYTIGGWRERESVDPPSSSNKAPRPMTFLDGWVTKPIKYHKPGKMNEPYASVSAFPLKSSASDPLGVTVTRSMFDTTLNDTGTPANALRDRLSTCLPDTQSAERFSQVAGVMVSLATLVPTLALSIAGIPTIGDMFAGSMACFTQYTCYHDPPTGYQQFSLVRASSNARANQITCIQPFPIMSTQQANGLVDTSIGPLAGPSTAWLTSNIWTSGEDAYTPTFPMESVTRGPESENRWYYQLVYDKKQISRTAIWDNAKMQEYFDGTTINYIRQSTCQDDFYETDAQGNPVPVDPRCFGFLQVALSNYKFSPMTLMGTISNAVIPPS
jgi:hypothetical protein